MYKLGVWSNRKWKNRKQTPKETFLFLCICICIILCIRQDIKRYKTVNFVAASTPTVVHVAVCIRFIKIQLHSGHGKISYALRALIHEIVSCVSGIVIHNVSGHEATWTSMNNNMDTHMHIILANIFYI